MKAIQKIFHVVCMKKDTEPISYVYKCIEAYIDVLIRNNKEESSAEILNNMVKLIRDEDADNKEQIEKFYVILLGVYIILGEEKNFNDLVEIVEGGSNLRMIQKIKKSINDKDEKDFKNNLDDAEYVLPGQMCKKIRGIFKSSLPKQEDMIIQTKIPGRYICKPTGVMQIVSIHDLQHFLRLCGCEELKAPHSLLED